jgi:hypothetical protein
MIFHFVMYRLMGNIEFFAKLADPHISPAFLKLMPLYCFDFQLQNI